MCAIEIAPYLNIHINENYLFLIGTVLVVKVVNEFKSPVKKGRLTSEFKAITLEADLERSHVGWKKEVVQNVVRTRITIHFIPKQKEVELERGAIEL